jgi:hypothetical protein
MNLERDRGSGPADWLNLGLDPCERVQRSGSGSELVRTSEPVIIFTNFQEK